MLEIFVLITMCRYLHKTATGKGWPGWPFVLLMIFGWFAFGIGGGILGIVVTGDDGDLPVGGIIGYLAGVVLACLSNAMIVGILPNKSVKDDDDRDYSPRRRGDARWEDEYEDDRRPRTAQARDDRDDREWRRTRDDR
jgi:hypothetical protein